MRSVWQLMRRLIQPVFWLNANHHPGSTFRSQPTNKTSVSGYRDFLLRTSFFEFAAFLSLDGSFCPASCFLISFNSPCSLSTLALRCVTRSSQRLMASSRSLTAVSTSAWARATHYSFSLSIMSMLGILPMRSDTMRFCSVNLERQVGFFLGNMRRIVALPWQSFANQVPRCMKAPLQPRGRFCAKYPLDN